MPTITNDLAAIVAGLDQQITGLDEKITVTSDRLGELQQELTSIQGNKANYSGGVSHTTAEVSRLQQELTRATTDTTLARGTSIESAKQQERASVQEQLSWAEVQLSTLQASFSNDSKAESETVARIVETQNEIAQILIEKQDAVASRDRFDREHASHVRSIGLAALQECDDEIDTLEAKLRDARAQRYLTQVEGASNLRKWPEMAEATLAEHGTFDLGPDARLLSARLDLINALDEASPGARKIAAVALPLDSLTLYNGLAGWRMTEERRIATGGWHSDTNMQHFAEHVAECERLLGELRRADRQAQAAALVREQTTS
jgi:hypothetical protein